MLYLWPFKFYVGLSVRSLVGFNLIWSFESDRRTHFWQVHLSINKTLTMTAIDWYYIAGGLLGGHEKTFLNITKIQTGYLCTTRYLSFYFQIWSRIDINFPPRPHKFLRLSLSLNNRMEMICDTMLIRDLCRWPPHSPSNIQYNL